MHACCLHGELLPLEAPVLHLLGRELDRSAAPGFWQWLRQIFKHAGALVPEVVAGIEHCYLLTQAKAPHHTAFHLSIPLTYARVMSEPESTAIIAHELAHFADCDADYSDFSWLGRPFRHHERAWSCRQLSLSRDGE